jgi:hypothetical protein
MGHVLMKNRNGLLVQTFLAEVTGRAERDAAMLMAESIPARKRVTLGGDKNYDTQEFVRELRGMNITPHVAQNTTKRRSAVDERTTRHAGYEVSQRKRKRVEQSFGWMKMIGMLKKVKLRGIDKVGWLFIFTGAASGPVKSFLSAPLHALLRVVLFVFFLPSASTITARS